MHHDVDEIRNEVVLSSFLFRLYRFISNKQFNFYFYILKDFKENKQMNESINKIQKRNQMQYNIKKKNIENYH